MTFPDDSLQDLAGTGNWWVEHKAASLCRGALIHAFVPYVDQTPYCFEPVGRTSPTEHGSAQVKVAPLRVNQPLQQTALPVAAMTLNSNEVWAAYRAKVRPCLIFANPGISVESALKRGKPNRSTAPAFLAAPYYGIASSAKRSGYNEDFVERVRHCQYPQFHWDHLPIPKGEESILRLDHLQPIGAHHDAYRLSGFKLSDEAMALMDEMLAWLLSGAVPSGTLEAYRQIVSTSFIAAS